MRTSTSVTKNDPYKACFKGGNLSVCCSMRVDEEAVTR
jgi:hypothetical protein